MPCMSVRVAGRPQGLPGAWKLHVGSAAASSLDKGAPRLHGGRINWRCAAQAQAGWPGALAAGGPSPGTSPSRPSGCRSCRTVLGLACLGTVPTYRTIRSTLGLAPEAGHRACAGRSAAPVVASCSTHGAEDGPPTLESMPPMRPPTAHHVWHQFHKVVPLMLR